MVDNFCQIIIRGQKCAKGSSQQGEPLCRWRSRRSFEIKTIRHVISLRISLVKCGECRSENHTLPIYFKGRQRLEDRSIELVHVVACNGRQLLPDNNSGPKMCERLISARRAFMSVAE